MFTTKLVTGYAFPNFIAAPKDVGTAREFSSTPSF